MNLEITVSLVGAKLRSTRNKSKPKSQQLQGRLPAIGPEETAEKHHAGGAAADLKVEGLLDFGSKLRVHAALACLRLVFFRVLEEFWSWEGWLPEFEFPCLSRILPLAAGSRVKEVRKNNVHASSIEY